MGTWKPGRVWLVAASVSIALHLVGVGLVAGSAWAGRVSGRMQTLPLLSHRDVSFLMGYIRASAESEGDRPREDAAASKPGEAAMAPASEATPKGTVAVTPRAKDPGPTGVREPLPSPPAPPPPPRKAPDPVSLPPKSPDARALPEADAPAVTVDAALVESVGASDRSAPPDVRLPPDRYLYMERLRQRIARNCQFLLSKQAQEARGVAVFDVVVHRSGAIREIRYRQHSDYPGLDVLAEQALLRSAPFPPFYQAMDMQYVCFQIPIRFGQALRRAGP